MTREELCYTLGRLAVASDFEDSKIRGRFDRLVDEAERRGLVRGNRGEGRGYLVYGEDESYMPRCLSHLPFSARGYAFLYWLGLGQPEDARFVTIADPERLARQTLGTGPRPRSFTPTELQRLDLSGAPVLRLVAPANAGEHGDGEPEESAEQPNDRRSPTLDELLTAIEATAGVRLVAFDLDEDTVVYGGELLDELAGEG